MAIATVQLPNGKIAEVEVPQGATPQEIESFVMSQPEFAQQPTAQQTPEAAPQTQEPQSFQQRNMERVKNVAMGVPQGLGNAAIGGFQAATDVGEKAAQLIEKLYFGDVLNQSTIGSRLASGVKQRKEEQAKLPASERVGIAIGETAPYLAAGAGTGARVAAATGSKIAGLAASGAMGGAVSSGLSQQEEAGLENRVEKAATGAAIGTAIGGGLGIAGKAASTASGGLVQLGKDVLTGYKARPVEAIAGFTSKPIETLDTIGAAIKDKSSSLYKSMRESGAVLKPETTKAVFTGIDDALKESGILNPRLHGDTIGVLDDLKVLARKKNGAIGLEELDQYRQLLGDVVRKNTDVGGIVNADALKANIAINKLDDVVEGLGGKALTKGDQESIDTLNIAREEWKRFRKFDAITNIVRKADGDPNRIKTLLQNFVNNPKNLRGFTKPEVEALKRAKTNSTAEGLMKGLGKFGFDIGSGRNAGNTALPFIGAGVTGFAGGTSTAGLTVAIGTLARQAQKLSARGQVDDVLRLIQGEAPEISSKVIQKLPPKTRDYVLTNILTQSINKD